MNVFRKIASALCYAGAIGGGIAMFLMMAQVGADVAMKYLLNKPIKYTLEMVSSYYMVAVVFLPLGLVTKEKAHVLVELFTQGLSKRGLAIVDTFAYLLAFAYTYLITKQAIRVALEKTEVRESWEAATIDIQVWPARWFLPIGTALMALYLIVLILENLCVIFGKSSDDDDAPEQTDPSHQPNSADAKSHARKPARDIENALKDPTVWSL
jgi:TRAP-type C4-dicarboxylate transport system permease small subunit